MDLLPYMRLAAPLGELPRRGGGSMLRHQLDTMAVLLEYGHGDDPVLLKAALVHDLLEDVAEAQPGDITALEHGPEVLAVVLEVTRRDDESKAQFLARIQDTGSRRARLLKSADRVSNLVSLGLSDDPAFIRKYTDESEAQVLPICREVDALMAEELEALISSRRALLRAEEG